MIRFEIHTPASLSGIVTCFWRLHIPDTATSACRELIVPDGHHEVILHLHEGQARGQG